MVAKSVIAIVCLLWMFCGVSSGIASDYAVYSGRLPPINFQDDSGKARGITVEILQEIMAEAGQPIELSDIRFIDWADAMEEVAKNPKAMLISAALTPEREYRYKWVGPVAGVNIGLIGRKDAKIDLKGGADISQYKIAVIKGSAPASMLRAACQGCEGKAIVIVDSNADQFQLLKEGKVDMIGHSDMSTPVFMKQFGMDVDEYEMVHVLTRINLYILLNKKVDSTLVVKMQNALSDMKRSRFEAIVDKYLGGGALFMRIN